MMIKANGERERENKIPENARKTTNDRRIDF